MSSKELPIRIIKTKKLKALQSQVTGLSIEITSARDFIKEIENGNLAIEFQNGHSEQNAAEALGESLVSMRNQMRKIAEDEKQRNWTTEGLAKFIDILRSNNDDLKSLGSIIISSVIKYLNANQGSLYILNDNDLSDVYLEMIACYAYDRKKHMVKNIPVGEGLVGQCVLEKAPVYMTNLPPDYLKITSGLGEALPKNLLIVPLIVNEKVYGVIEMASFHIFQQHHRDFIEKLAESIASTIANVRINEQTKKLLIETQTQAEQMRAQEEEMRQNMEELTATQEEMQRVLQDVEKKEKYLNQLLNVSPDSIFTIDRQYRLVSWNKTFAKTLEQFGMQLEKGMSTMDWYTGEERTNQKGLYDRVLNGETFDFTASSDQNGKAFYHLSIYAPLRNEEGEVSEAAIFAKDVTVMMNAQKELQAQEEELRQNMEELTATQEEMQRVLKSVEAKERYLNQLLNVSTDSIFTIDREYKLVSWNSTFAKTLEQFGMQLEKGMNTMDWYTGEERIKQKGLYDRVLDGETFDFTASSDQNGKAFYHLSIYAPLRNEDGQISEAAIFAKDVTVMMNAQKELQAQEEELRQNMEELKATQEEMAKTEILMAGQLAAINNSMATIEFTLDGKVVAANDKFCAATGYSFEEVNGKHHRMFLAEEDAKTAAYSKFWKDLNAGIAQTGEFKRVGKNGAQIWISASYTVVKDAQGKPLKVIKFAMDITEQKLKTLDHEGQINAINNTMAEIEFDLQGKILDANDNFLSTVGYNKSEILGQHHAMFVDAESKSSKAYKTFWSDLRAGIAQTGEFKRFGKAGKPIWISASYTPIRDASGKVYKVIKFAQNITSQKLKSVDYEGQINAIRRSTGVIEFDLSGNIIFVNDLFLKAMGYDSSSDVLNRHHSIFVSEFEVKSAEYKKFWQRLAQGEFFTGEFQRKKANGESIWIYGSYNPILDADGKPYKVVKYAQVVNKNAQVASERVNVPAL